MGFSVEPFWGDTSETPNTLQTVYLTNTLSGKPVSITLNTGDYWGNLQVPIELDGTTYHHIYLPKHSNDTQNISVYTYYRRPVFLTNDDGGKCELQWGSLPNIDCRFCLNREFDRRQLLKDSAILMPYFFTMGTTILFMVQKIIYQIDRILKETKPPSNPSPTPEKRRRMNSPYELPIDRTFEEQRQP